MKKGKRFLSVILAVLMACSSLTVGFYAIAAETAAEESTEEVTAVSQLESNIKAFYDKNYHSRMFSVKEEEAEEKEAALAAFDDICKAIKALTDAEKLELNLSNYVFMLGVAADKVGRDAGKTSTAAKVYGVSAEGFKTVTEMMGALPADYQKALEFAQSFYVKVNNSLFNSSFDFKSKADGFAHYEANIEKIQELSAAGVNFANYLAPAGDAFNISCYAPTSTGTNLFTNVAGITFNYYQDKNTKTGKNPSSVNYSTYINRDFSTGVCTWKNKYTAVDYKAAFDNYFALTESETVPPARDAYKKTVDLFSAVYGDDFKAAAMAAYETGLKNYNTGEITVVEIKDTLAKIDAAAGDAAAALNSFMSNSNFKVAAKIKVPANIEFTAETTAAAVYANQISVETKYVSQLIQALRDVLTTLQVKEFEDAVNAVDLDNLNDETVEAVRAMYVAIPTAFQKTVDADVFAKFTKIIMPKVSHDTLEDVAASFVTTPINRAAINSDIAWTEEGIQMSVDGTWETVNAVLAILKPQVNGKPLDLSNGLNDVLKDNLYQVTIVEALFDLYATLSHNETETGVSMAPTLGKVITMLLSTTTIKNCFVQPDNKYQAVYDKLNAAVLTDEEKEAGLNLYDKFAEIEFTAEDFGFTNGDKQGFIDALLAVLRPIAYLLSGDNGILGMAGVKIAMFDSVGSDGVYNEGIYSMLLPMLEELGLTGLATPAEYKANYDAQRAVHKNLGYDALLREIVESLFDKVVQPIADSPLNGLIAVLPRLAYVVDSNMVDDTVKTVIQSTGNTLAGLAGGLDLSAKAINKMIAGVTISIDENTQIKLKPIDWDIVADCATLSPEKSSVNARDYFTLRTGEVDSCFTNVFFYIYNVVFADKDNFAAINGLLKSALNGVALGMVQGIVDGIAGKDKYAGYNFFLQMTAKEPGETPIPRTKSVAQQRFIDLQFESNYDDYVAYTSVYNSFITGTNPPKNNVFSPRVTISRAMFVTILYRMSGSPYDNGNNPYGTKTPFTDITNTGIYYYNAACWAYDEGVTDQLLFKPNNNVSRAEAATMLFRYAQANDMVDDAYLETDISSYHDYGTIREWAKEPMQWANYNGMITGTEQGYANPEGATLRIHATKILYGFGRVCDIGSFK